MIVEFDIVTYLVFVSRCLCYYSEHNTLLMYLLQHVSATAR